MSSSSLIIGAYELLGVEYTASDKDINSAFRKKALKCHPDKFPGDKKAAEKFDKLQKALEVLSDPGKRQQLDDHLKATQAKRKRDAEMGVKRKEMKRKLEEREAMASGGASTIWTGATAEGDNGEAKPITTEDLRQQMKSKIQEELARKRASKETANSTSTATSTSSMPSHPAAQDEEDDRTIRLKWKNEGDYNEASIRSLFTGIATIEHVIVAGKSSIVVFHSVADANRAMGKSLRLLSPSITATWPSQTKFSENRSSDPMVDASAHQHTTRAAAFGVRV
jgi:DnaJ family protein C protein 17